MTAKRTDKPKWTAAERARHRMIREKFKDRPTLEELEARGELSGEPMKNGAYFAVRVLLHELKQARLAAGITLADVADRSGIDETTLSKLENGRQRNPTADTLWRYANGVGKRLLLTFANAEPGGRKKVAAGKANA